MNCVKCGNKLDNNSSYCNICGSIVRNEEKVTLKQQEKIDEVVNKVRKTSKKRSRISYIVILCIIVLVVGLIYLILFESKNNKTMSIENNETTTKELIFGSSDLFNIAKTIDFNTTYESLISIIGYEGKLIDTNTYSFNGSKGETMNVTFNESFIYSIEIEYDLSMLKNNKTDLVNVESMKNKIDSGLSISELISTFGDTYYVIKKDNSTTSYSWVNINEYEVTAIVDTLGNVLEINF